MPKPQSKEPQTESPMPLVTRQQELLKKEYPQQTVVTRATNNQYDPETTPKLIRAMRNTGHNFEQIRREIGIALSTLHEWKNKYADVADALKRDLTKANGEVKESLLRRATGFEYEETETTIVRKGSETETRVRKTKKFYPPDATSMIFWLKNKCSEEFSDRTEQHHSGSISAREASIDEIEFRQKLLADKEAQAQLRAIYARLNPGR